MDPSKRCWIFMIGILLLDSMLVESKKMDIVKRELLQISERMTSDERKAVDFTTSVAIEGALMALSVSNPLVGIFAGFFVGSLIDAIWPTNAYEAIRAKVLEDIRKEMNHQSVERMKLKLRDYRNQIKHLFDVLNLSGQKLTEWRNSVTSKGLSLNNQRQQLEDLKNRAGTQSFDYFKTKLIALTTDIGNDRQNFYIPSDPVSSLAYYREFATIQINLLAAELVVMAGDNKNMGLRTKLLNKLKSITESHYRFVLWATHKSAAKVEDKTKKWEKYNEAVKMVVSQFPLKEWKKLSSFNDDSKYIRDGNVVSLHAVSKKRSSSSKYYGWMSCWGSGSKCKLRTCPGIDNPFETGNQHKYHYKCRGEVFWIRGNNRYNSKYIEVCDKVALQYSYKKDKKQGYWLSLDSKSFWWSKSHFYNTRTCPGVNFFNSRFDGRCGNEVFTLSVEGKKCGDKLEDRDVVRLRDKDGKHVGGLIDPLKPSNYDKWRIFKHGSFLKNYYKAK